MQAGDEMSPRQLVLRVAVVAMSVLTGVVGHGLIARAQRLIDVGTISVIHVGQPAIAVMSGVGRAGERVALVQLPRAADPRRPGRLHAPDRARLVRRATAESPGANCPAPGSNGVTPTRSTWSSSPASIRGILLFRRMLCRLELLDRACDDLPSAARRRPWRCGPDGSCPAIPA